VTARRRTESAAVPARLRRAVAREVSPARLRHIRGTARMARRLATMYGLDSRRCATAAWLHDAARDWPVARMLGMAMPAWLAAIRRAYRPWGAPLLHAPASAAWALERGLCTDAAILMAVARHPTGGARMTPLARMLLVADYCEPTREFAAAGALRMALTGLTLAQAAARVAREKADHVRVRGGRVHPQTHAAGGRAAGRPGQEQAA